MVTLVSLTNSGRQSVPVAVVSLAVGIVLTACVQKAGLSNGTTQIPVRKADQETILPEDKALSMGQSIIETVGQTRYEPLGQQKEGVEFIWTPALLMQQVLRDEVLITYPAE